MKRFYVTNLREGTKVDDVFLVVSKSVASTRSGSPFLKIRLADKTGEVEAVKWEATESEISRLTEDDYVLVHGNVNSYKDNLQVQLDSFQRNGEPVDPSDFLRCTERDPKQMMSEFLGIISSVSNPHLRQLLDSFFKNSELAKAFCQAPAAKSLHHAYIGGLLEHSLGVVKGCAAIAGVYPDVDKDVLLTAGALHDIGKIEEFVWSSSIKYSEAGNLVGHVVGGAMMVKEAASRIPGFDPLLSLMLQHMILSHHGLKEYGSPKQSECIEAEILHHADDMDAKVSMFSQWIEESDDNGEDGLFTKKHFNLDRPLFKGLRNQKVIRDTIPGEEPNLDLLTVHVDYDPFADE